MGQLISQFQEDYGLGEYNFDGNPFRTHSDSGPRIHHHNWLPEQTKEARDNYEDIAGINWFKKLVRPWLE